MTIEKKGKAYAVLISPKQYEALQDMAKERLFRLIDDVHQRNAEAKEDEVLQDVTEVVDKVRQERYEKGV